MHKRRVYNKKTMGIADVLNKWEDIYNKNIKNKKNKYGHQG